jgi:hypothetical protein
MRNPDLTKEITWKSFKVTVREWCDQTDIPWDGEFPLEEGSEGFDLYVEVSLMIGDVRFEGASSLGSVWVAPNDYTNIQEEFENVIQEALANLHSEILLIAGGRDVRDARRRAQVASVLVKELATTADSLAVTPA